MNRERSRSPVAGMKPLYMNDGIPPQRAPIASMRGRAPPTNRSYRNGGGPANSTNYNAVGYDRYPMDTDRNVPAHPAIREDRVSYPDRRRRGGFEHAGRLSDRGVFQGEDARFQSAGVPITYNDDIRDNSDGYQGYDGLPNDVGFGPREHVKGGFQSRGKFEVSYPDQGREYGQRQRLPFDRNMERGDFNNISDGDSFERRDGRVARPGDWTCVDCKVSNFAFRTTCFKCQKDKPNDAPETLSLNNWECTECFAHNHSKRFDCFKCQKPKPKNAKECGNLADWECSGCQRMNAARRTNCFKCDASRPGRENELNANPDWKCKACSIMNWSWRDTCYKCQANKSDGSVPEGLPQEWDCIGCGANNWARRNQCFKCKARRC